MLIIYPWVVYVKRTFLIFFNDESGKPCYNIFINKKQNSISRETKYKRKGSACRETAL